jgi:glycosyltransferase involved in cell wall biosynthesis
VNVRLLNVVSDFLPFGLGEHAALMAPWLANQFQVGFFSLGQAAAEHVAEPLAGLLHQPFRGPRRNWPAAAWRLRSLLFEGSYDIVHAWGPLATRVAAWALASRGVLGRRIVLVSRIDEAHTNPLASEPLACWRRPDVRLAVGVETTAPTVDPRLLQPIATIRRCRADVARSRAELRSSLGLAPSAELIGTVCSLEAATGVKHLIWAADLVNCVRDDVRLIVWGQGSQRDQLKRYAGQIGDRHKYHWLGPDADLRRILLGVDLYWQPHRDSRAGGALASALAAGTPAVAVESLVTRKWAADCPSLRLVDWGARDEMARKTLRWFESKPTYSPCSVASAWTDQAAAEAHESFYRECLAFRNARRAQSS